MKNIQSPSSRGQAIASKTRLQFPLILALLCLIGLVAWFFIPRHQSKQVPAPPPTEAAAEPAPVASAPNEPNRVAGDLGLYKGLQLEYTFSQDRVLNLSGSSFGGIIATGALSHSVQMRVQQKGDLVVTVYDQDARGWLVGFKLQDAKIQMSAGTNATSAADDSAAMGKEILASVERCGRIATMTAPPQTSAETLNQWRDILARWQIVLPVRAGELKWKRTEEDTTGSYLAEYTRDKPATPATLTKSKHRYLKFANLDKQSRIPGHEIHGTATIDLNPYPTLIKGHEQLSIAAREIGGGVECEATYVLQIKGQTTLADIEQLAPGKIQEFQASAQPFTWAAAISKTTDKARWQATAQSTTIAAELSALDDLLAQGKGRTPEEVRTLEKIVDLIHADDATVDKIVEKLASATTQTNTELASALTGMLGAAGTPEAQEALIALANSPDWPLAYREMALFSFAQVTEPRAEVDAWLQALHQKDDDLSKPAYLVLAAMGDRLRESDPERYASISQYITDAANKPDLSLDGRLAALRAIENLGPATIPDFVRTALNDEDPLLRAQAVESLRRMPVETAYEVIRNSLAQDGDSTVRTAAARMLADSRYEGAVAELARTATTDAAEAVRMAALESLNEWAAQSARAMEILQQAASQDKSEDVRKRATDLLASAQAFAAGGPGH